MKNNTNILQQHFSKNPIFWTKLRKEIFYLALSNDGCSDLNNTIFDNLNIKRKDESTKSNKESYLREEIDLIYDYCIDNGIIQIDKKVNKTTKYYRHSELSLSDNAINYLHTAQTVYLKMWSKHMNSITVDDLILPFASSLARDGAANYSVILHTIKNMRLCDITTEKNIAIPISKANVSNHCFELTLPNISRLILAKCIFTKYNNKEDSYVFYPEIEDTVKREERISSELEMKYIEMISNISTNKNAIDMPIKFNTYLNLLSQFCLRKGIPPFAMSILGNLPLPTTNYWNDNLSFFRKNKISNNKLKKQNIKDLPGNSKEIKIKIEMRDNSTVKINAIQWRDNANAQLKELRNSFKSIKVKRLKDHTKKVDAIIKKHLMDADSMACPGSALHLAIEWSGDRIINQRVNKTSSLKTYHSSIFSNALFFYKDAPDLLNIKPSEHQEIINDIIANQINTQNTSNQFISMLLSLYSFAYTKGYINHESLKITDKEIRKSQRSIILYPSLYDKAIKKWRDKEDYNYNLLAIAADLSYYIGLRSDELASLKLQDIVIFGNMCIIIVREGKSSNAPRNQPYYILAPMENIKFLHEVYQSRKSLSNGDLSIPLFGPSDNTKGYNKKQFIHSLSCGLKHAFSKSHYVPHILRHAFQNNLLIRLLSIDKPEILNHIDDAEHEIFSQNSISSLSSLVYSKQEDGIIGKENTALWIMAKLLGHKTPAEGLYTYCHIYVTLIKAYFDDINKINDEEIKLTRAAVALLIPNTSSSQKIWNKYKGKITISEANYEAWNMFTQKS